MVTTSKYPGCREFHPTHNRRMSDNPLYNKLVFQGYHIQGEYLKDPIAEAKGDANWDGWTSFLDSYPTLEAYYRSFSFVEDRHVLSPREIFLAKEDPSQGERNIKVWDNAKNLLWDQDIEDAFLAAL